MGLGCGVDSGKRFDFRVGVLILALTGGHDHAVGGQPGNEDAPDRDGLYSSPPGFSISSPHVQSGGDPLDAHHFAPSPPSHSYTGTDDEEDPPVPYVYLMGTKHRDLAGVSRLIQPDQNPDTWLRLYLRNLLYVLGRGVGTPRWPGIKALVLRTRGAANYRQWDTLPGSLFPLLQVEVQGRLVNGFDGSIAGIQPSAEGSIDLFIGDEGPIASRHVPLVLDIFTLQGKYSIDVRLWCSPRDNLCT